MRMTRTLGTISETTVPEPPWPFLPLSAHIGKSHDVSLCSFELDHDGCVFGFALHVSCVSDYPRA